jgi:hypothetical protein
MTAWHAAAVRSLVTQAQAAAKRFRYIRQSRHALAGAARTASVLLLVVAGACSDSTAPAGIGSKDGAPPGKLLLDSRELTFAWTWLPGGQEILFGTPFEYPYTGPPARLEAISVPGGVRRTIASAPSGASIIPYSFRVQGAHVYFHVWYPFTDKIGYYRASVTGSGAPELVLDSATFGKAVSPDERTVAWVQADGAGLSWAVVTVELASGVRRVYPLQQPGDGIVWSPSGRSVVVQTDGWTATGTPFQWLDLTSGTVRVWLAPSDEVTVESSRDFGWEGETPFLYTAGAQGVVRYSLASGAREVLSTRPESGRAVGWSPDFGVVSLAAEQCVRSATGPFGGGCLRWNNTVERLALSSGQRTNVLQFEGSAPIFGRLSPSGAWLAYTYGACGGGCYTAGDGLYVVQIP